MSRFPLLALFALGLLGCGPDEYTCADPIDTTVTVSLSGPIDVDPAQPDAQPTIPVQAYLQVDCNMRPDSLEIASAALVDFYTEDKILDFPLKFKGGVEGTPTCEGIGTTSKVEVVAEGITNADLAPQCNRANLGLLTVIKRAGCAETDEATRISKALISVQCP